MTPDLKPCPLCGNKALIGHSKSIDSKHFPLVNVYCTNVVNCGCRITWRRDLDEAVRVWNGRVRIEPE